MHWVSSKKSEAMKKKQENWRGKQRTHHQEQKAHQRATHVQRDRTLYSLNRINGHQAVEVTRNTGKVIERTYWTPINLKYQTRA